MSKEANDALFNAIHDEFHRCVDLLKKIRGHNKSLPDKIKRILEQHNSLCLDTEAEREKLYNVLIAELKLDIIDDALKSEPDPTRNEQIDLFDISYLNNKKK